MRSVSPRQAPQTHGTAIWLVTTRVAMLQGTNYVEALEIHTSTHTNYHSDKVVYTGNNHTVNKRIIFIQPSLSHSEKVYALQGSELATSRVNAKASIARTPIELT